MKTVWVVLLSKDWYYVWENWELPKGRPEWDKEFITNLVKDRIVLCSKNTLAGLPESIIKTASHFTSNPGDDWDINFWIGTFKEWCEVFIIIRSTENMEKGSIFKMKYIYDMYEQIMDLNNIELFIKK